LPLRGLEVVTLDTHGTGTRLDTRRFQRARVLTQIRYDLAT
jgi:hypothetical protein